MTKVKTRKSILGLNWVKLKPAEDKSKSSLGLEIPYWFWTSDVLKFNKKKSLSFLLKKEKEIINKYPSTGDGGRAPPHTPCLLLKIIYEFRI